MGTLTPLDITPNIDDLVTRGLTTHDRVPPDFRAWRHTDRDLTVVANIENYPLEEAHAFRFGIRRWRHVSAGVVGQLQARLADQKAIGRKRGPGERSPAPLPDWYDLTHLVYEHGAELGFDPNFPVFQELPPAWAPYLNIAEVLHLRQPQ